MLFSPMLAKFWSKVTIPTTIGWQNKCWEWNGCVTKESGHNRQTAGVSGGYGQFRVGRTRYRAHRWIFQKIHGWLPDVVDHTCNNRRCVNPNHLRASDLSDNLVQAYARGQRDVPF